MCPPPFILTAFAFVPDERVRPFYFKVLYTVTNICDPHSSNLYILLLHTYTHYKQEEVQNNFYGVN